MESLLPYLLPIHVGATLYMTGVIWFVQLVHYPLMAFVGRDGFEAYEQRHARWTTFVVGPPMLLEVATALVLILKPGVVPTIEAWVGLALVTLIWISTAVLQVPQHRALEKGFDVNAHRRLVRSNWARTVAWSVRSVIVLNWWSAAS